MNVSAKMRALLAREDVERIVVNGEVIDDDVQIETCVTVAPVEDTDAELVGEPLDPNEVRDDVQQVIGTIVKRGDPEHDDGDFAMTFTEDQSDDPDLDPQVSVEWRPHFLDGAEHELETGDMVSVPPAHYWG